MLCPLSPHLTIVAVPHWTIDAVPLPVSNLFLSSLLRAGLSSLHHTAVPLISNSSTSALSTSPPLCFSPTACYSVSFFAPLKLYHHQQIIPASTNANPPPTPQQATNREECGDVFADCGAVDDVAVDNFAVKNVADELDVAKDYFMSGENEITKG